MNANTPYALYDNDGKRSMQWAAHIRLTPELLLKLQQNPEQVLLTLNANSSSGSGSGGAVRKSTKKTSLLSVNMGASAAGGDGSESEGSGLVTRYELHSFHEDPRVNYFATFRQDRAQAPVPTGDQSGGQADTNESSSGGGGGGGGYSVYTTGKIYQKLIVQRMLDSTEKDRMKDRHAQSVMESRSRASKLLEDHPPAAGKRKRVSLFSTQFAKPDVKVADVPVRKRILRSALTAEDAQKTKERIQKGFEKEIIPPPAAAAPAAVVALSNQQSTTKPSTKAAVSKTKGESAAQASLFSSDSDGSDKEEEAKKQKEPNGGGAAPASAEAADQLAVEALAKEKTSGDAKDTEDTPDAPPAEPATGATTSALTADSTQQTSQVAPLKQQPKARKPPVVSETKRPLPRASRIPDLSFFPREVGLICKRTSAHITRTVVLDEEDYDTFVQQYESFRADWETLDKAYSIEMINIEGLHVRLKLAAGDQERADLERERQENARKREALLFVRDAMASIQKILSSIQVSIARYDRKQLQ